MKFANLRPALLAMAFTVLASSSHAQSLGGSPGMIGAPGPNASGVAPAAGVAGRSSAPADLGSLGSFPEQLMTDLSLTAPQRALVDEAQAARKKMWADNQVSRKAEYDELAKELKRGADFDPRAVTAMRKKARTEMQDRMDAVQDLWLKFWDALDAKQRLKMVDYMIAQHERHGKIRRSGP